MENASPQEKVVSARAAESRAKEGQDRMVEILHRQSNTATPSPTK